MKENRELIKEVLRDIQKDMTDEEVLALLADSRVSVNPSEEKEKYTLGQRAADAIAKFAGSWAFIFSFTGGLVLWMVVNALLAARAFDPYPFILLNLVLSCIAAIQAPLIMMSQNRQEEKDRRRAENDYKVNLKTEIMIEDLYDKVNAILAKQSALEKRLNAQSGESAASGPSNESKKNLSVGARKTALLSVKDGRAVQTVEKPLESSRGPKPSRISIVPSGMYGGHGRIFAAENPIFQSKNRFLAVFAPGNLKDFSKNW